tara:strand:- start:138 stop:581 length:444 start_codon:yes stop_codon:yes gene_type:complete
MKLESTRNIDLIVLHCSDTYSHMDIDVSVINDWHRARGWSGCGYHFFIKRDGTIETGRDLNIPGAHAYGYNKNSIGICYAGGKGDDGQPEDNRTNEQKRALAALLINLEVEHPMVEIKGHNELSSKACPCYDVQQDLKLIDTYLFLL